MTSLYVVRELPNSHPLSTAENSAANPPSDHTELPEKPIGGLPLTLMLFAAFSYQAMRQESLVEFFSDELRSPHDHHF
jgi:hypothetical protein